MMLRAGMTRFLAGLRQPSPLAAGVAVGLTLVAVAIAIGEITADAIARAGRTRLAIHSEDYDAVATSSVLAFARAPRPSSVLVVLGGSTTRASLLEEDLGRVVEESTGTGVVLKLCTSRQSLWDSIVLAEQLPAGLRGYAIVGVGPSLFSMGDDTLTSLGEQPRLGVRSEAFDRAQEARGAKVGPRTGIYAIDNAPFLLARRARLAAAAIGMRATPYVDSVYQAERSAVGARGWKTRAERVAERYPSVEQNWAANAALLERLIDLLQRVGLKVVLVETPVNPRFTRERDADGVGVAHIRRMRAFADRRRLPYVVLNDAARLEESDFFDWAHIRTRDGARRCAEAVRPYLWPAEVSS
jgi:hypothetical protein